MIAEFFQIDRELFRWINEQAINSWLDGFMPTIAEPRLFLPFLGAGALALLIWGGFRGRIFVLLMALALGIGDAGINCTIKHLTHRPRPYQAMEGVRMVKRGHLTVSGPPVPVTDGQSFTSGHACNNVALAFMACMVYGRAASFLWVWALLISYSRVYTGDHYPTDILGSWVISLLYSWMIVTCLERLWQKFALPWFPRLNSLHPTLFPVRKSDEK